LDRAYCCLTGAPTGDGPDSGITPPIDASCT
jgi:hypothetical protein